MQPLLRVSVWWLLAIVFFWTEDGGSTWTRRDFAENLVLTGVVLMSKSCHRCGSGWGD